MGKENAYMDKTGVHSETKADCINEEGECHLK